MNPNQAPMKASIFKTYERAPGEKNNSKSFATFMIIGPTCFFLGVLFSLFPYDYPLLWTSDATPAAYYDQVETHLKFLHASPPIIPRILHIAIFIGLSGFFIKLFKPSEANLLFDGSSLALYVIGITVYLANIVKGLRLVTDGLYLAPEATPEGEIPLLPREEALKVLAASNTILALILVGVLVLQAGHWYAERKDGEEVEALEKKTAAERSSPKSQRMTRASSKKNK